jgi:hypothetical protein
MDFTAGIKLMTGEQSVIQDCYRNITACGFIQPFSGAILSDQG